MMTRQLLKTLGFATLVLLLHTTGFAQNVSSGDAEAADNDTTPSHRFDEITIRHKGDKDAKVTIEIRNGEVFINGKPAADYKDDDLVIRSRRLKEGDILFDGGNDLVVSPFRYKGGTYSFDGGGPGYRARKYTVGGGAFLGVTSLKSESGPEGAKVGEVSEGSAAEKAGLKEGDVIIKVDYKKIDGPEALTEAIRKDHKPGDKVAITYLRGGKEQKATAELGKSKTGNYQIYGFNNDLQRDLQDRMELQQRKFEDLQRLDGMRNFNFEFRGEPRLGIRAQDTEDGKGVKVLDVEDESAASKAGIKEGDIITRFDGQEVNSATRLAELARARKGEQPKPTVKVDLLRGGKPLQVEVKTPRKLQTTNL